MTCFSTNDLQYIQLTTAEVNTHIYTENQLYIIQNLPQKQERQDMEADEEAKGNIQELYNLDPQLQVGLKKW